jgi:hypothetical protein
MPEMIAAESFNSLLDNSGASVVDRSRASRSPEARR